MVVDELAVQLGINIDGGGFEKAERMLKGLGAAAAAIVAGIGAVAVALNEVIKTVAENGAEIERTSQKLGIATDKLQELRFAAQIAHVGPEEMSVGLQHLARQAEMAATQGGEMAAVFQRAGVRLTDSSGKLRPIDVLLGDIADHFQKLPNGTLKTGQAMELLGRSGAELIPLLNRGRDGLAEFGQEAHDFGYVLDEKAIAASKRYQETQDKLRLALIGLRNTIAGPLIQAAGRFTEAMTKWIVANRAWIATAIHKAIRFVTEAGRDLLQILESVVGTVKFLLVDLKLMYPLMVYLAGIAAVWAAGLLYLYGPMLLLVGAIALLLLFIDDLYTYATGGDSVFGRMLAQLDRFDPSSNPLVELLKSVLSLIFDVTDEQKWQRLGRAFVRIGEIVGGWIMDLFRFLWSEAQALAVKAIAWVKDHALDIVKGIASAIPGGSLAVEGFSTISHMFGGGAASPAASAGASTSTSKSAVVNNRLAPQITVQAPPGGDPKAYGDAAANALDSWWNTQTGPASVAVDQ